MSRLHNLGADPSTSHALATCLPDNNCSVWGSTYIHHPSWGVAFYKRFTEGNVTRENLLYGHIFFNTLSFVLMMYQIYRPGFGSASALHRWVGYGSMLSLTIGVGAACMLAAEHGAIPQYGGDLSKQGFWFMASCVYGCALMGLVKIWSGDMEGHRKWMMRYGGSMWGAFWLFRVMEFALGPLLRGWDTVSILLDIWGSAPLGIMVSEVIRRNGLAAVNKKVE
jgi:hypothetical protein